MSYRLFVDTPEKYHDFGECVSIGAAKKRFDRYAPMMTVRSAYILTGNKTYAVWENGSWARCVPCSEIRRNEKKAAVKAAIRSCKAELSAAGSPADEIAVMNKYGAEIYYAALA